ncbi:MAG: hypothetical protein CL607_07470 [Anaerolineaceae bacterium]|nr:hypothetical protein [Anaerolineaceae bacterium]
MRIYNKFNSYPTRKAMRWLERAEDLVKDNGERVKQPTPIERYDEDDNFRLYANEQIDFWVDKTMREDGSKSVYIIRLAKSLHFIDGDYGYHNWLKGHKKPLPADSDDMPTESIEF